VVGFVALRDKLMWGLFNQNPFSFAGDSGREDVNASILQPILNYSLLDKWSVGTSEMNVTYGWDRDAWTALPLGPDPESACARRPWHSASPSPRSEAGSRIMFPDIVISIANQFPNISIDVLSAPTSQLAEGLIDRKLDMIICPPLQRAQETSRQPLASLPAVRQG